MRTGQPLGFDELMIVNPGSRDSGSVRRLELLRKEITMARVTGVKEKLHMPIYDAFFVKEGEDFQTAMSRQDPRMIRFFVDVQNKTRLETNLQASGVLPSLNTFEARAMRVVVSSLRMIPPFEQPLEANFLSELIYTSVTSLLVGEKTMIEMPTFYFPAGAGVSQGAGPEGGNFTATVLNHGQPDPMSTFRFAEPVTIEPQQNFRVEMLFPQSVPLIVSRAPGPLRIWVVLDGYLTRDVQ
jgi:hypothetical protein